MGTAHLSYRRSTINPLPPETNVLVRCHVSLPPSFPATTAGLYGPATPGQTGPLILDLGQPNIVTNADLIVITWPPVTNSTPPVTSTSLVFTNELVLNEQQLNELKAGLWYVNVASIDHPAGEIRGQITSAPVLTNPRLSGAGFALNVTAPPNINYAIEFSTNLLNWSTLATVNTTNSLFEFVDPQSTNSLRNFYRVRSL